MFDKEGDRIIFFEGTYTHTFSGNPDQTPRYDYNQIMYQLDLSDPRLALPVPFVVRHESAVPFVVRRPEREVKESAVPLVVRHESAVPGL
jgi:hypothetical protein